MTLVMPMMKLLPEDGPKVPVFACLCFDSYLFWLGLFLF